MFVYVILIGFMNGPILYLAHGSLILPTISEEPMPAESIRSEASTARSLACLRYWVQGLCLLIFRSLIVRVGPVPDFHDYVCVYIASDFLLSE